MQDARATRFAHSPSIDALVGPHRDEPPPTQPIQGTQSRHRSPTCPRQSISRITRGGLAVLVMAERSGDPARPSGCARQRLPREAPPPYGAATGCTRNVFPEIPRHRDASRITRNALHRLNPEHAHRPARARICSARASSLSATRRARQVTPSHGIRPTILHASVRAVSSPSSLRTLDALPPRLRVCSSPLRTLPWPASLVTSTAIAFLSPRGSRSFAEHQPLRVSTALHSHLGRASGGSTLRRYLGRPAIASVTSIQAAAALLLPLRGTSRLRGSSRINKKLMGGGTSSPWSSQPSAATSKKCPCLAARGARRSTDSRPCNDIPSPPNLPASLRDCRPQSARRRDCSAIRRQPWVPTMLPTPACRRSTEP